MPKIAPHYFRVKLSSRQDDIYAYKAEVSVTSQGSFAIRIPDELEPSCRELIKDGYAKNPARGVQLNKGKVAWAVHSFDKTVAVKLIEDAARIFATAEIIVEIVICYAHEFEGRYVVGPTGDIATDIYDLEKNFGQAREGWKGTAREHNHFGSRACLKFGVGAQVYKKTTIKRATGTSIEYDLYWGEGASHFDRKSYCQRLNSLDVSFSLNQGGYKRSDHKEIPYTEQGARFFFESMIAMCSLNERIKKFLGDSSALQKAIETSSTRLLG